MNKRKISVSEPSASLIAVPVYSTLVLSAETLLPPHYSYTLMASR